MSAMPREVSIKYSFRKPRGNIDALYRLLFSIRIFFFIIVKADLEGVTFAYRCCMRRFYRAIVASSTYKSLLV